MTTQPWFPFDIRNDPVFEQIIKPAILKQIQEMEAYDNLRNAAQHALGRPDITYVFHKHAEEVALDVKAAAATLGQPEHVQEALYWAVLIHDIGKKTMPVETWDSIEKPTGDVKEARRKHTDYGLTLANEIFKDIEDHPFVKLAKDVIHYHHVNIDGSGYPKNVTGDMISDPVKLICIAESFSGYITTRPHYGHNRTVTEVIEKMYNEPDKGAKMFDIPMLQVFAAMKLTAKVSPASSPTVPQWERPI